MTFTVLEQLFLAGTWELASPNFKANQKNKLKRLQDNTQFKLVHLEQ